MLNIHNIINIFVIIVRLRLKQNNEYENREEKCLKKGNINTRLQRKKAKEKNTNRKRKTQQENLLETAIKEIK